jgi:hypothetical protein
MYPLREDEEEHGERDPLYLVGINISKTQAKFVSTSANLHSGSKFLSSFPHIPGDR